MAISRRTMIWGGVATAAVTGAGLFAQNPARALPVLNLIDRVTPGDAAVVRIASDIAFGSGERQKLDIYAPTERSGTLPVVIFYYGGGWNMGARREYGFAGRAFAAQGFIVVVPDYRLVPEVRFPAFLEDGAASVDWVVKNIAAHGGDPARIGVTGHSAGGYNAAMLALDPRWGASPHIRALVGLSGPYDFYPFDNASSKAAFGQAADPQLTQPMHFVRGDAPPSLLLSGDADTVVRPRNAQNLSLALIAKGADASAKFYPGVGHNGVVMALAQPFRRIAPVLADASAFFHARL